MSHGYQTIKFRLEGGIGTLQFYRPQANNTINDLLIRECRQVLANYAEKMSILVLEGLPEVFCFGADFQNIHETSSQQRAIDDSEAQGPEVLYDLWLQLANGPFLSIAHVRGKANAGGVGFVAACDIVLADNKAVFSLSELLFGLYPACVLPFLMRRIGFQKAHYMTLMTQPIPVEEAHRWGLVDVYSADSTDLLRKHLLRLRRLSKPGIARYKEYMSSLDGFLKASKSAAVKGNREVFTDPDNLEKISRFVTTGQFPWEKERP